MPLGKALYKRSGNFAELVRFSWMVLSLAACTGLPSYSFYTAPPSQYFHPTMYKCRPCFKNRCQDPGPQCPFYHGDADNLRKLLLGNRFVDPTKPYAGVASQRFMLLEYKSKPCPAGVWCPPIYQRYCVGHHGADERHVVDFAKYGEERHCAELLPRLIHSLNVWLCATDTKPRRAKTTATQTSYAVTSNCAFNDTVRPAAARRPGCRKFHCPLVVFLMRQVRVTSSARHSLQKFRLLARRPPQSPLHRLPCGWCATLLLPAT